MLEVLTSLKVLDYNEIVWGQGKYETLWRGLRQEFDVTERFEILSTKLDVLKESHPFFLQVIHQGQSHRMEVIIIALIAIEVVIAITSHLVDHLSPPKNECGCCTNQQDHEKKLAATSS
jgi:uncharacterized Rmd1/YagE family protein